MAVVKLQKSPTSQWQLNRFLASGGLLNRKSDLQCPPGFLWSGVDANWPPPVMLNSRFIGQGQAVRRVRTLSYFLRTSTTATSLKSHPFSVFFKRH